MYIWARNLVDWQVFTPWWSFCTLYTQWTKVRTYVTNCCTYIPCTVMDSFTKLHPVYLYCTTVTCTRCSWRLELTYITYMYVITLL